MQRRYPGRHGERGGPPDWQERNERAPRGAGERDIPDDPARWPDAGDEPAYRRFASENVGPEDWGSEWSERAARPVGQRRGGADAGRQGDFPRRPARDPDPGYGERDYHAQGRDGGESPYRGVPPEFRGHHRMGGYDRDRACGDPYGNRRYGGDAPDLSRFGSDAERDALRNRRGPKGYTRSDERIREDVCERLAHALDIDVSDVTVQVQDGRVELDGTVPARWMKHGIEDLADGCMGVRDVENRVRVRRDEGEQADSRMVLHPDQRTVTPTQPAALDPEPGTVERDRERKPHH
ncbi:BON domain-containing protein [Burkholderia sp. Se-20373]|uniref:BON domain-containing protein n=1 Tax=Burkholderia sp. Se-20373 TaxID=2703898 RepID=UPI00197ECCFD|nr:BON domain-containing protein [Burkholderia sp. Se-20373]MBN3748978.1 BON domain-containing protein [Burkholderia sp. Se-20373]